MAAGGRRSGRNPPSPPHLKSKRWRDRDRDRDGGGGGGGDGGGGQHPAEELPGDRPVDGAVTSDLASPGRQEPPRCDGIIKSRRMLGSSTPSCTLVPRACAAESPLPRPSIRAGHAPGPTGTFVPFPGARTHHSWGSMWDIYNRLGGGHPGHPCRLPVVPHRHRLELSPFCAPPPHVPHRMETVTLRRREALNFWTHQPPPPGFLVPSHPGL